MKNLPKLIAFSLLPALVLLAGAETIIRLTRLSRPSIFTLPLPEEAANLMQADDDLFWSMRPNLDTWFSGFSLQTNSLGLRSEEILPKREDEFRILSLGESSTFGFGVANGETYSALLKEFLQPTVQSRSITTINAGVSAYSSFQSLKYLELRGLALKPDLILFYHEVNDYLPSSLRDSSNTEVGVIKTDKELFESTNNILVNTAMRHSALLRYLSSRYAMWKIESLDTDDFPNPLNHIGMARISVRSLVNSEPGDQAESDPDYSDYNEMSLGQRVSEKERLENFGRLLALSREHDVQLVLIHPSYAQSARHQCVLTKFAAANRVLMFEAHRSLHLPDQPPGLFFQDFWHPNRRGHVRLANALSQFIAEHVEIDPRPTS